MENACQHSSLVNTGEFLVCVSCGLAQEPNYQCSYQPDQNKEKLGREKDLEELARFIKDTCARCHINGCIRDRALMLLNRARSKFKGKTHSSYSRRNIITCAHLLYLSFQQEGEPRSIKDIESMFGFATLGITRKRFWKEAGRLGELTKGVQQTQLASPPPSSYVRELLTASDQLGLLRWPSYPPLQYACRLADAFVGTGNHRPRNVMLALLYHRVCDKETRQRLLETSFLSSSTISRMNKKIADFEKKYKTESKPLPSI